MLHIYFKRDNGLWGNFKFSPLSPDTFGWLCLEEKLFGSGFSYFFLFFGVLGFFFFEKMTGGCLKLFIGRLQHYRLHDIG